MSTTVQSLLEMKEQIAEAKTEKAQAEGRLSALMEQLKKEYEVKTIKEAKVLLKKLEREVDESERLIKKGIEELENVYDW